MKRRPVSPFSLSFLDIMFCGFGAVVLLVLIMNHEVVETRGNAFADLRADIVRLEQESLIGIKALTTVRNSLESSEQELVATDGEAERVIETSREVEVEIARYEKETLARRPHVNRLQTDLETLRDEKRRLGAPEAGKRDSGEKLLEITGDGDRQYLTGLRLGGKRTLILIDASASMLDESIVNVIRRRNMDDARKRDAPKWKRTLATADWLVANLPRDRQFQLYTFNTEARPVFTAGGSAWLSTSDPAHIGAVSNKLRAAIPGGGTSLHHAYAAAAGLSPRPDNIVLVTDGLPTQGAEKPSRTTVSGNQRLDLFNQASKTLPAGIPVNTILLPMEGDMYAAAAFWSLGVRTRGSFMTPARDWP